MSQAVAVLWVERMVPEGLAMSSPTSPMCRAEGEAPEALGASKAKRVSVKSLHPSLSTAEFTSILPFLT